MSTNGNREHTIALLPPGELGDNTELVFVDGRVFVNEAKHELVVDVLIRRLERQHRQLWAGAFVNLVLAALLTICAW